MRRTNIRHLRPLSVERVRDIGRKTTGVEPEAPTYLEREVRVFLMQTEMAKRTLARDFKRLIFLNVRAFYRNQGGIRGLKAHWQRARFLRLAMQIGRFRHQYYSTGLLGNVNGDGLIDYVVSLPFIDSNMPTNGTYLHAEQALQVDNWRRAPSARSLRYRDQVRARVASELVDINGDGLDDWMSAGSGSITFCLNTGTSWESCSSPWNIATSSRGINGWDRGIRFIDINGDGLLDYVRSYSISYDEQVHRSPRHRKGLIQLRLSQYRFRLGDEHSSGSGNNRRVPTIYHPDRGADGSSTTSWSIGTATAFSIPIGLTSTTTKPDLLTRITLPTGGTKEVGYTFSSQQASRESEPRVSDAAWSRARRTAMGSGRARRRSTRTKAGRCISPATCAIVASRGLRRSRSKTRLGITHTYYHQGDTASTTGGRSRPTASRSSESRIAKMCSRLLQHAEEDVLSVERGRTSVSSDDDERATRHSLDLERSSSQYASISDAQPDRSRYLRATHARRVGEVRERCRARRQRTAFVDEARRDGQSALVQLATCESRHRSALDTR